MKQKDKQFLKKYDSYNWKIIIDQFCQQRIYLIKKEHKAPVIDIPCGFQYNNTCVDINQLYLKNKIEQNIFQRILQQNSDLISYCWSNFQK